MSTADELRAAGVPVQPTETQSEAFITVLKALGHSFKLNLCNDTVEVNGTALSDVLAARIRVQMRDRGVKNLAAVEDAYTTEAANNAYHPIKQYLNNLEWDGVDYISLLIAKIASDNEPVVYADGSTLPLHGVYLYRWLIGAVAKVLEGAQNPMLVWDGLQGLGKSLLAAWLCSGLPDYFIESAINVADKDNDVRLMTRFIWEVSELDATTRKADVSALKAFITKGKVTVRKSYGRNDITKPATASMIGTVNNSTGFLADETGSRRFYIARLTKIDWSYRQLDIDQIWAQAVHLWNEGEPHTLTSEERAAQELVNQQYEVETPLEDWVRTHFLNTEDPDDRLTAGEIISHLASRDIKLSGSERAQAMEIGRVLTRLGLQKLHTRTGNYWLGMVLSMAE